MTLEEDALLEVTGTLERLRIPHMVTGSVASSFHGRPRLTHDADIVISREELGRRRAAELSPGHRVAIASAEDTILSKLEWSKRPGRSEKQIEDAAGVLAVDPGIDRAYIERWACELGLLELWQESTDRSQ